MRAPNKNSQTGSSYLEGIQERSILMQIINPWRPQLRWHFVEWWAARKMGRESPPFASASARPRRPRRPPHASASEARFPCFLDAVGGGSIPSRGRRMFLPRNREFRARLDVCRLGWENVSLIYKICYHKQLIHREGYASKGTESHRRPRAPALLVLGWRKSRAAAWPIQIMGSDKICPSLDKFSALFYSDLLCGKAKYF